MTCTQLYIDLYGSLAMQSIPLGCSKIFRPLLHVYRMRFFARFDILVPNLDRFVGLTGNQSSTIQFCFR